MYLVQVRALVGPDDSFHALDHYRWIPYHRVGGRMACTLEEKSHRIPSFNCNVFQPIRNLLGVNRRNFRPAAYGPYLPVFVQDTGPNGATVLRTRILPDGS